MSLWVPIFWTFLASAAATDHGAMPPAAGLLTIANHYFQKGEYHLAAAMYEQLAAQGVRNGPFYLNQGNAHFLASQLPQAILAYRRAERFMPNDARLQANLTEARSRVLDPPVGLGSPWSTWLPRWSRPFQAQLALGCYLLGWGTLTYWLVKGGRWPVLVGLGFLALAIGLGTVVLWQERQDAVYPLAVIAADGTVLRKGNGESYPPHEVNSVAVKLNRGVEARVLHQRQNGWVQIELANGWIGWVPKDQVLLDREPTS